MEGKRLELHWSKRPKSRLRDLKWFGLLQRFRQDRLRQNDWNWAVRRHLRLRKCEINTNFLVLGRLECPLPKSRSISKLQKLLGGSRQIPLFLQLILSKCSREFEVKTNSLQKRAIRIVCAHGVRDGQQVGEDNRRPHVLSVYRIDRPKMLWILENWWMRLLKYIWWAWRSFFTSSLFPVFRPRSTQNALAWQIWLVQSSYAYYYCFWLLFRPWFPALQSIICWSRCSTTNIFDVLDKSEKSRVGIYFCAVVLYDTEVPDAKRPRCHDRYLQTKWSWQKNRSRQQFWFYYCHFRLRQHERAASNRMLHIK